MPSNPLLHRRAIELRHNLTDAESRLWYRLRSHRFEGIHFRRQHVIGNYVVDFCAPRCKLVIEVDGGQHLDQAEYDAQRTEYLNSKGYRVLRFWNNEVMQEIEVVLQVIEMELRKDGR